MKKIAAVLLLLTCSLHSIHAQDAPPARETIRTYLPGIWKVLVSDSTIYFERASTYTDPGTYYIINAEGHVMIKRKRDKSIPVRCGYGNTNSDFERYGYWRMEDNSIISISMKDTPESAFYYVTKINNRQLVLERKINTF